VMKQFMHSFVGHVAPEAILDGVARGQIRSFCLFADQNVESPAQLRQLNLTLWQAAIDNGEPPPLIGIDQEGGQLIAIRGGTTELPGNMALGATRSPELAYQAGAVLGRELLAMGVNLNLAPALDVNINPQNPVVGTRSFGDDPEWVSKLGVALINGLRDQGVMAAAKHFPGHGDTSVDSHYAAAVVHHNAARLNEVELKPFRAAISAGVPAILTAHVTYTALDQDYPATLSARILTKLLREELGFTGLIITDAMDMHAVTRFGVEESIERALNAGADMILLAHLEDQLAMAERFAGKENPQSIVRIMAAQRQVPKDMPPLSVLGSQAHQSIAKEIAERSITLVRDDDNQLPLPSSSDSIIGIVTVQARNLTPADTSADVEVGLAKRIRERHRNILDLSLPQSPSESEIGEVLAQLNDADTVIVGTINAEQDPGQAELVRQLLARGKSPVVIALRTPYDISAFPEIRTYICTYSIRAVTIEALVGVLFGEIPASGMLPCTIPGVTPQYSDGVIA
jgi:beta-N-acetylhexosaminidase